MSRPTQPGLFTTQAQGDAPTMTAINARCLLLTEDELRVVRTAEGEPTESLSPRTRVVATLLLALVAWQGRERQIPALWLAWFVGLGLLLAMDVRGGTLRRHTLFDHPDVGTAPLGVVRFAVGVVALVMFVLLFMPAPITL
jgi:hypothetical protein